MKSLGNGKNKAWWWILLWVSTEAFAINRTLWIYEGLSEPPAATHNEVSRHQIGLQAANFSDTLSFQLSGNLDLKYLELFGIYARRGFLSMGEVGRENRNSSLLNDSSILVEVARYFSTSWHHFGRLGVAYVRFPNSFLEGVRFSVATGVSKTAILPWEFRLKMAFFAPVSVGSKQMVTEITCLQSWGMLDAGGSLSWVYQPEESNLPIGKNESMLISFGPTFRLTWGSAVLVLGGKWRLAIDSERFLSKGQTVSSSPSEFFNVPDIEAKLSMSF